MPWFFVMQNIAKSPPVDSLPAEGALIEMLALVGRLGAFDFTDDLGIR